MTVATFGQQEREEFEEFGEIEWTGWVFAILALIVARPAALLVSFLGSGLSMREQLAAVWFGPKGFASVVYVLVVVTAGIPEGDLIFHLVALTIALSIIAHSSTDVMVARSFSRPDETPAWQGPPINNGSPPSSS